MPDKIPPSLDFDSPQVLPDRRVIFRLYAPKASDVSITGDWVSHGRGNDGPLQKMAWVSGR